MTPLRCRVGYTTWGWVGALASPLGLRRLSGPEPSGERALACLGPGAREARLDNGELAELLERVRRYLEGGRVTFDDPVDRALGTPFQRTVWEAARRIPWGETRSYGWVAARLGIPGGSRAVGQALSVNPVALVIPCHRVVGADGSLRGYRGGGPQLKRRLLELEQRTARHAPTGT